MKKIIIFLVIVGAGFALHASAATQTIISWDSPTYVPKEYTGKQLPVGGSSVETAVDVVRDGAVLNLSQQNVYWYVDGRLVRSGRGETRISIEAPERGGRPIGVRVELPGMGIIKGIDIPVVFPEAVIVAPFPEQTFSATRLSLRGEPYFFNTKNRNTLSYSWEVSGQKPQSSEFPEYLSIDISNAPARLSMPVSLNISNTSRAYEGDTSDITLYFVK